ncbi:MAG: glutamate 5-kinase [Eubacteriales bacterium]|nr:glutamate 5-kinase [Eubacteriales bacterium]
MSKEEKKLQEEGLRYRESLKDRKRIVVKVGSSSLLHPETGRVNYHKIDRLARELSNIKNKGKEVILVSSGATAVGREVVHAGAELVKDDSPIAVKQACASIGQARLMMIYQKCFDDYNQLTGQVLMTKNTVTNNLSKYNLHNTFTELLKLNVIPIVNENDSVATYEYKVGDNDTLSAMVASLMQADLLILLSDVDGLFTDDPRTNEDARFIEYVPQLSETMMEMGKSSTGSSSGTGGMSTKLSAARIATASGCDMIIVNSRNMAILHDIMVGKNVGTLFRQNRAEYFDLQEYIEELDY